jgi:hydroxymethylglutaryl-CoA lyase
VRKPYLDAVQSTSSLIREAVSSGVAVRAGVQCAFGCVYEGAISPARVFATIEEFALAGATECNLADTAGTAIPLHVRELVLAIQKRFPEIVLSLHLHDTRGLAVANMLAGFEAGVRLFDTSAGGLGGCPFVKGAAGNIATEDCVHLFDAMGVQTGISLNKLCETTRLYQQLLGKRLPGRICGVFEALNK